MINLLDIKTPAQPQAAALRSDYGLDNHGLFNLGGVYWNLPPEALYEEIVFRREGTITRDGAIVMNTGKHTARSANDKFVVRESSTEEHVWWGQYNRPFAPDKFNELFSRLQGFLQGRDVFVQDCYVGADPEYRMPVRIITEHAWHSLFARNMFIPLKTNEEYRRHVPDFTVICCPAFKGIPQIDGTGSNTFITLSFDQRLCIIGNTAYAGEIKKSVFTVMNYLMPLQGVFPMHSSANVGGDGDVAVFFGLSGTGKTTLSADPNRVLLGDDEHGWSNEGVFNFEGGCYAKTIRLSREAEPEIYATTERFGTILENVIVDEGTRLPNFDDASKTENTRCAYPLDFIPNASETGRAGHPKNIVMLTCDAFGVLPPIAKLTGAEAMYHFLSGYTAKVAGTEKGVKDPEATFSTCFGAPFMPRHPSVYGNLLRDLIDRHHVDCWLVNTGWTGGKFGTGRRMPIRVTRRLLAAALEGTLSRADFRRDPYFGFAVPTSVPGVEPHILYPVKTWQDKAEFSETAKRLVAMFRDNFKRFEAHVDDAVKAAAPTNSLAA